MSNQPNEAIHHTAPAFGERERDAYTAHARSLADAAEQIHHESMIGTHFDGRISSVTVNRLKVTCGECAQELAAEI